MRRQIQHYATAVLGLFLFGIALLIIHHKLGQYRYHDIVREIKLIPGTCILVAMILAALDYLVLTA
jgi:uncharacterized membrane protein YbhN (UPF0104 family)